MKLYNTLTQKKEDFVPLKGRHVGMYHCGPTVYDYVHIGNLRSFMLGDFIRRTLEFNDYSVTQVMNITDVGHLVSDGDEGDDKMTKALKRNGKEINLENMLEVAEFYSTAFKKDLSKLSILTPHHFPKASDHIVEDINIIKQLEEKGFTYINSDGIYFNTQKMPDYGKLGGLNLDSENASRIGKHLEKKHQADFALWKFDEKQGWDSPWGLGFPGWHIECSGMSMKYLGDQFDIHTGGADLKSIHHNNEIAQSECASGCSPFVKYWMHGEMLNFGGAKLSKSTGGNITLQKLEEKGFNPLSYRYLALQTHYRSPMNFTWDILLSAQNRLEKIYRHINTLRLNTTIIPEVHTTNNHFKQQFKDALNDDINLPQALAVFHQMMKSDINDPDKLATAYDFDRVLGLGLKNYKKPKTEIPENIQELLSKRQEARKNKNWQESDRIRDEISKMGFKVLDVDEKQIIEKK